jgi:hypothetical protein
VQWAKTKSRPAPSGKPDCAVAKQDRVSNKSNAGTVRAIVVIPLS